MSAALTTGLQLSGLVITMVVWFAALALSGAYTNRLRSVGRARLTAVIRAAVRSFAAFAIAATLIPGIVIADLVITTAFLATATALLRWAVLSRVARLGIGPTPVVVRGGREDVAALLGLLERDKDSAYSVVAVQVTDPSIIDLRDSADRNLVPSSVDPVEATRQYGASALLCVGPQPNSSRSLRQIAWSLERAGLGFLMIPVVATISTPSVASFGSTGLPLLTFDGRDLGAEIGFTKVALDRLAALVCLIAAAPALIAIGVLVAATSRGGVLFRQTRIGRDGSRFEMLKIRTMYHDAEERKKKLAANNQHVGGTLFKIKDDPRVTPVGRVLRRYSLDELPQLLNVLKGDMSLIGPRPPLPEEVANYAEEDHRRFRVRPGLTGLWQVSGRSDLNPTESARLDIQYVEQWSMVLDLKILMRTPRAVISCEGAY